MNAIDELVETIAKGDSSSWDIADHVAVLPQRGEDGYVPLREIAGAIYEQLGVEWSPAVLSKYAQTSRAFPDGARAPSVSFKVHEVLRTQPEKLIKWATKNPGKRMSIETAVNMRGGMTAHRATQDAWKQRFNAAARTLDNLAENDPAYAVDLVEQMARNWKARFPKALAKVRDLRAV
jgi:hypothetical protein